MLARLTPHISSDVLPNPSEFAKDMGLWSLALILPQVVAAPASGVLLDYFQGIYPGWNLGYTAVFLTTAVYFVLGTYYVKKIEMVH